MNLTNRDGLALGVAAFALLTGKGFKNAFVAGTIARMAMNAIEWPGLSPLPDTICGQPTGQLMASVGSFIASQVED